MRHSLATSVHLRFAAACFVAASAAVLIYAAQRQDREVARYVGPLTAAFGFATTAGSLAAATQRPSIDLTKLEDNERLELAA